MKLNGLAALALCALCCSSNAFELKGLTLGSPTTPAQVHSLMGVPCGVGANDMQVCNGPASIGGVWGDANIVISPSGKLQRISLLFDANSFESLAEAFVEKYGKASIQRSTVQNGFGAKFERVDMAWTQKNGNRIDMSKNASRAGRAYIGFSTPEDRKLTRDVDRAKRSDL